MVRERRRYERVAQYELYVGKEVTIPDGLKAVVIEKSDGKIKVRYVGEQTIGIYAEQELSGEVRTEPELEGAEEQKEVSTDG